MGNFYTNFTLFGAQRDAVRTFLKQNNRRAYLGPEHNGNCFVYDSGCESQDIEEIEFVGKALSQELGCVVLSALNHDDDYFILRLFADGKVVGQYNRFWDGAVFSFQLAYHCKKVMSFPTVVLSLTFPFLLFQSIRYHAFARSFGLPPWVVCLGYKYIREGALPAGMDKSHFELV